MTTDKITKYHYHFRPCFGSDKLMLEFIDRVEKPQFISELFDTIRTINPQADNITDLWMNDEILIQVKSDLGQFQISKDIWNFAFIISDDNQTCLTKINELLNLDNRFSKVEIDNNNYK